MSTRATRTMGKHGAARAGAWLLAGAIAGLVVAGTGRAQAQETVPPPPQAQVQVQAQPPAQVVIVPAQPAPQPIYVQQPQGYAPQGYVVAQPGYAPVQQPMPPPRRRGGGHVGLIISGAVLLGVGWISNFIVGLPAGDDLFSGGARPEWEAFRYSSLIPVVGPWVQLAVKPTAFSQDDWAIWLIFNGLMQATGTALLVAGIATSGDDGGSADSGTGPQLVVVPNVGRDHAGLTVAGSF